jgi:hypothetical protein
MNDRKTRSMLQRVPVILAVTAASYGLQLPPAFGRPIGTNGSPGISARQPATLVVVQPTANRRTS